MNSTQEVVYSTDFEGLKIDVLWIEYDGGGMCYEFRISAGDTIVSESESEYGSAASAAAGAFKWIDEELEDIQAAPEPEEPTDHKIHFQHGEYAMSLKKGSVTIQRGDGPTMTLTGWRPLYEAFRNFTIDQTDLAAAIDIYEQEAAKHS